MLSSNEIVRFFDNQYLYKESVNFLDFFQEIVTNERERMRVLILVWVVRLLSHTQTLQEQAEVFLDDMRGIGRFK